MFVVKRAGLLTPLMGILPSVNICSPTKENWKLVEIWIEAI